MKFKLLQKILLSCIISISLQAAYTQQLYFPDSTWQTKKPSELKMNAALTDSAVSFAIYNDKIAAKAIGRIDFL